MYIHTYAYIYVEREREGGVQLMEMYEHSTGIKKFTVVGIEVIGEGVEMVRIGRGGRLQLRRRIIIQLHFY